MNSKKSTVLYLAYLLLLVSLSLYVSSVLKNKNVDVITVDNEKPAKIHKETKPAKVTLNIVRDGKTIALKYEMTTNDSVEDLLRFARARKQIDYEIDRYTNGLIINVSNNNAQDNPWKVIFNNDNITNLISEKSLNDSDVYILTNQ